MNSDASGALCAAVLLLLCSCNPLGPLQSTISDSVDKVVAEITSVQNKATGASHDWQKEVTDLQDKLTRDGSDIAKQALSQVQQIVQESGQLIAEHIPCNEDIVSDHVNTRLNNLIHSLKHDGKTEVYIPRVCSVAPMTIELSNPILTHLSIDGAFFLNANEPRLAIQNDSGIAPVNIPVISRSSNYEMTVNLDQIKQAGLIGIQSRKLLIYSPPNTQVPLEVAIQQAPSCVDNIKNQLETDVDCGGPCHPCGLIRTCREDKDCQGNTCANQRCGYHKLEARNPGWIRFGGGTGGDHFSDSSCGPGQVAVGFFARTGAYFDAIGLWCTVLHGDGTVGEPIRRAQQIGGNGGNHEQSYFCPRPGQVLVGLFGRTGSALDQVGGTCAYPHDIAMNNPHLEMGTAIKPSGGGGDVGANCGAANNAVTALQVKSGAMIDSLSFACSAITRTVPSVGGPVTQLQLLQRLQR